MDIAVPTLVASGAQRIAASLRDTSVYVEAEDLRFRATPTGLPNGWVLERLASFEIEQPLAGLSIVPCVHLVNVPAFIHDRAYVAVNPISGQIVGADNDIRSVLATALVHLAFTAPFSAADGDRWNRMFIDLTMPAIAEYVIQNPRTASNPGAGFYVVRRCDYEAYLNGAPSIPPVLNRSETYFHAVKMCDAANAAALAGDAPEEA